MSLCSVFVMHSLHELLRHDHNGMVFHSSEELSCQLEVRYRFCFFLGGGEGGGVCFVLVIPVWELGVMDNFNIVLVAFV